MSDKPKPQHAPIRLLTIENDRLIIAGRDAEALAAVAGQTPFYVYDSEAMTRRVAELRAAMPEGLSLHYAMKANPMPAVVSHMAGLVDGLDVASMGELKVALQTGTDPRHISFAGPGKSDRELAAAIAAGITLNLESEGEMERLAHLGGTMGLRPRAAIRVNPDFELKASGMKMAGGPKPFGVDAERVPQMLQRLAELEVDFVGFHIFSGSQNLRPESLIEAHDATFALAYQLAESAPTALRSLNIGGGLGIPYFPGEQPLPLEEISANLARHLEEARSRLSGTEIVMELGRYFVGEAGAYVCRVVDKKESRGVTYLVTDGGLHQHLAASGNFGQVIRKNYPVINPMRVADGPKETVSIVGPLCTPLDILGDKMEIGQAEPGDLVAVLQSGAYGYTASPHLFLSHPPPVEICL